MAFLAIHLPAHWGDWEAALYCPYDEWVIGFDSKPGDYWDDNVGLNSVKVVCAGGQELISRELNNGNWQGASTGCDGGFTKAKAYLPSVRMDPFTVA